MKKRITSALLALVMLLSLMPAMGLRADALTSGYTQSDYMRYIMKTNTFDVQGMPASGSTPTRDIQTTYGNAGYYTYIRNTEAAGTNGTNINPFGGTFTTTDGSIVQVNTTLDFVSGGRYVQVTYTLRNTGSTATSVDIGFGADTMVYATDAAPIEETATGLRMYSDSNKAMTATDDYMFDLVVKGVAGSAQDASTIWFGYWSHNSANIFTPDPSTDAGSSNSDRATSSSTTPSIRGNSGGYVSLETTYDSGLAASWKGISLNADGGTKVIKFQFGVLQKADMVVDITDASANNGTGGFTVSVAGGSGDFLYGFLYNATAAPTGSVNDVPVATTTSAGKWQADSGFSIGILPGYYKVFYKDKQDGTVNGSSNIIVYNATKINYDTVGGALPTGTTTPTYGNRGGSLSLPNPTKSGYTFSGWNVTFISDNSRLYNTYSGGATFQIPATIDANKGILQDTVTLTAQWVKSGTVTCQNLSADAPATGYAMPTSHIVTAGTVLTLQNLTAPTDWTFDGWYKGADRTTLLPGGAVTTISDEDLIGSGPFTLTFYAKWTKNVTIEFTNGVDDNSVTEMPSSMSVYPGSTVSLPAAPTRSSYSFAGWKIDSETYPARGAYTTPTISGKTATFVAQWVVSGTQITIAATRGSAAVKTGKSSQSLTLTATVNDTNSNPITGGSAVFYDGGQRIGDSSVLDGIATITLSGVAAGEHSYTASYTGVTGTYNGLTKDSCSAVSYRSTDKERPTVAIIDDTFKSSGLTWDSDNSWWYKTYDGDALSLTGTITPPATSYVTYTVDPEVTYNGGANAPKDAGSYTVKAALADTDDYYAVTSESYTVVIFPKEISPVISANNKVYDGTESAILSVRFESLTATADSVDTDGKTIYGDSVIASASGSFTNERVGTSTFNLADIYISGGANRDNYVLPSDPTNKYTPSGSATINPALVTFSVSNTSQVYDGTAKEITVVGSSSPSKEWELNADSGFNVFYKYSNGDPLGAENTGGLGKKPVAAGTYTYEITCKDPNFKLSDKWKDSTGQYAQTGTITITSGGVSDFKFDTSSGGAKFYANTMHAVYGDESFKFLAASDALTAAHVNPTITYGSDKPSVVAVAADGTVTVKGVGNAVITATLTAANYVTTTVQYAVQVEKKTLSVGIAPLADITYGGAAPTSVSYTYDGLVPSDMTNSAPKAGVLSGTAGFDCAYSQGDNVGSYAVTPKGLTAANYDINFVPAALKVVPKTIKPTITASEKYYDGTTKAEFAVTFPGGQLCGSDQVYAQAVGAFTSADVNASGATISTRDVTVSSCALVGSTNYVLAPNSDSNWTIVPARIKPAIVTFVVANTTHNYDGSAKEIVVTAVASPVREWGKGTAYSVAYTQSGSPVTPKDKGDYGFTVTCLDNNYATSYTDGTAAMTSTGTLKITTNALTDFRFDQAQLTNNAKTVTYGDANFTITASSATAAAASSGGTTTYAVSDGNVAAVNSATGAITVKGAGVTVVTATIHHENDNYADATASYVLTVEKKALTITAKPAAEVIYGNNYIPAGVTYGAFANGDTVAALNVSALAYQTAYAPGSTVGSYTYTPYGVTAANYDITYVPGSFAVVKREVTPVLTAEDKLYDGKAAATVSVSWQAANANTGVVLGDVVDAVASGAVFNSADVAVNTQSAAINKTVTVNSVAITLGSGNYRLPESYIKTTTAKITPAAVTYIVNGQVHTYDGTVKEITVVPVAVPSMTGGYSISYATAQIANNGNADASLDGATGKPLTKGIYNFTVSTTNTNYTGSASGTLEIVANAQPAFAFTAPIVTATYGDSIILTASHAVAPVTTPAITYTSSNPAVAEINADTGVVTIHKSGTVTITARSVVASYNDATATCALIINKAALTVTAGDQTKVYGEENPLSGAGVTYSGWRYVDSPTFNDLVGELSYTYSCERYSGIGNSYTVTPSGRSSDCYDIVYKSGRMEITKRPVFVTITADDKYYDTTADATLNYSIGTVRGNAASGLVNNDIVDAAAVGTFVGTQDASKPGVDKTVSITNCQLITGGANYSISGFTKTDYAAITATAVDFTVLYVPSQYSENIGLTVITVPSIDRDLYTVDYYNADPTGKDDGWLANTANKVGSTHGANTSGSAPVFPGTYYFMVSANDNSGYSGYRIGSYTIDKMTQTGYVANPVVTVNAGSTTKNPVIHTNPILNNGMDAYGNAPVFTYQSSDPSVASIGWNSGILTGVKLGTATITVSSAFTGYYDVSWQYSVTVTSTMINTKLTESVQVANGSPLSPMTVIDYTPTGEGSTGPVTLVRGTGGGSVEVPLTHDYSIFLRDSRAVGDNDSAYPYIQTSLDGDGNVTAGVSEVGHYYIYIRMGSNYAAAGYGDNKVQIGHFYVIPAAPTVGPVGSGKDVEIDYVRETMSWNTALYGVGAVANAPLSVWADNDTDSNQYHNTVSVRPQSYASPANLSIGNATQNFASWKLGGDVNMSTMPGGVINFVIAARHAAPVSSHETDPIQINVASTYNSVTVTKLINYTAPASGVQYAAWPTADKANFNSSRATWFDTTITGLDAMTEYTVFVRVKASNDSASPCFASLGTEVTVTAPTDPGPGETPTPGGGASTGTPPSHPATVFSPTITESGTLNADGKPNSGIGKISGTQGTLTVSSDGKTVTITPPPKYRIKDVIANGKSVGPVGSYTFDKVTNSTTLNVVYEWNNPFKDVNEKDWYFDAVKLMHLSDIVEGTSTTTFSPKLDSLRVTLVTVLGRMSEINKSEYIGTSYSDIQAGSWYAPFVQWATENNIVEGYGNELFGVDDSLTREQVATLLYRYAKEYQKLTISFQRPNLIEAYLDSDSVSTWSYDAMRWCLETGILSGRGNGILDPKGACTRAELVQFLANFQRYVDSL